MKIDRLLLSLPLGSSPSLSRTFTPFKAHRLPFGSAFCFIHPGGPEGGWPPLPLPEDLSAQRAGDEKSLLPFKFTREKTPVCCKTPISVASEGKTVKSTKKQAHIIDTSALSTVRLSLHSKPGPSGLSIGFFLKHKASENSTAVLRLGPENLPCCSFSRKEHFKYR